jgi:hypothetical protein
MPMLRISLKWMRALFIPCLDFLACCRGRCCISAAMGMGVAVRLCSAAEREEWGTVLCEPHAGGRCPALLPSGFCAKYTSRPFDCRTSPFTVKNEKSPILVIKQRNTRFLCHTLARAGDPRGKPAYIAHKASLLEIVGDDAYLEIERAMQHDIYGSLAVKVPNDNMERLRIVCVHKGRK